MARRGGKGNKSRKVRKGTRKHRGGGLFNWFKKSGSANTAAAPASLKRQAGSRNLLANTRKNNANNNTPNWAKNYEYTGAGAQGKMSSYF